MSLGYYSTATDAKYAMYFLFFFLALPASFAVFKGKSVKMNVDDPGAGVRLNISKTTIIEILRFVNAPLQNDMERLHHFESRRRWVKNIKRVYRIEWKGFSPRKRSIQ